MKIFFKIIWATLCRRKIELSLLKKALAAQGYAIRDPYILYKDCRIAKMHIGKNEKVWLLTHSRHKAYTSRYLVRDLDVALYKCRQSYLNFLHAANRPGAYVPKIEITLHSNRHRGTVS